MATPVAVRQYDLLNLRHEIGGFGSLYLPRVARRLSRCARKNWSFLFAWLIR